VQRREAATLAILHSFGILVFFTVAGELLLIQMGIPLRAFQVAGGILLLLYTIQLTTSPTTLGATPDREGGDSLHALVVYPLAVPAIAGPGAMRTVRSARLRNGLSQWR